MIERGGGNIEMLCDECGDPLRGRVYDSDDFDILIADAKAEGWRITKEDREWVHYCPDCRSDR
jgi:hypothetical protein